MATKKRKSSSTRRASAKKRNPVNPVNSSKRRTTKRRTSAKKRNPVNPTYKTKRRWSTKGRRARRNPVTGVLGRAVPLVLASAGIGVAAPFVGSLAVRVAPQIATTPVGVAGVTFVTGWGLSALSKMFAFTRRWSDDILLAGAILAGGQLFSSYVAPMIRFGGGQANNGMGRRRGMNGIGVWPGVPEGIPMMAPPVGPPAAPGMNGLAAIPGVPAGVPR